MICTRAEHSVQTGWAAAVHTRSNARAHNNVALRWHLSVVTQVWVLVTGHEPLRAYMHTAGLVLFSTHSYDSEGFQDGAGVLAWTLLLLHLHAMLTHVTFFASVSAEAGAGAEPNV